MAKQRTTRGAGNGGLPSGVEWIGGIAAMPAYVTGEGEPYRPEGLFWMDADGAILGSKVARPGELLAKADESFRNTIEQPLHGRPHAPVRVRVASPELADVLRDRHPAIDIVCAPTPELDEMLAAMREAMQADPGADQSYLSSRVDPDAIASLFRATAELFRAGPWNVVPDDQCLFAVTIEALGVRDIAMSVIGQMGESFGLILFSGPNDFDAYVNAALDIEQGVEPELPPHFSLTFTRGADLAGELRTEIAKHGWEVASANAYPWLAAVDEDLVARTATPKEVTMAEAIALALTRALAEESSLQAAWDRGEALSRTFSVATHEGEMEVTLRAPYDPAGVEPVFSGDLLADLRALARDGDEIDPEVLRPLEDELVNRFAASPEAKGLSELHACRLVMDFAAAYFGATIATLGSTELKEIVFGLIPRKVSIDASEAGWIIEVNRAFYG